MTSGPVHVQHAVGAADARPCQGDAVDETESVSKVGVVSRALEEHSVAIVAVFEGWEDAVASAIGAVDGNEARVAVDRRGVGEQVKADLAPVVGRLC